MSARIIAFPGQPRRIVATVGDLVVEGRAEGGFLTPAELAAELPSGTLFVQGELELDDEDLASLHVELLAGYVSRGFLSVDQAVAHYLASGSPLDLELAEKLRVKSAALVAEIARKSE